MRWCQNAADGRDASSTALYRRACAPFDAARPGSYGSLSDQAMWTGALVGVWAFKHAVTGADFLLAYWMARHHLGDWES